MSNTDQSAEMAKKTMRSRSKKLKGAALTSLVSACYSSLALALPTGEQVINNGGGTLSFDRNTANTLQITQSAGRAIINWNNFDINQSELVKFIQTAGNNSVTLNRIGGNAATQISGALNANGNLFLINPAGIVFNNGAQVNVNGLLATTLNVDDATFMNNNTVGFAGASNSASSIKNMGEIKAGGAVYLIAPEVDNQGTITGTAVASRVGKVVLGAGDKFDVKFDSTNLVGFQINNITQSNSTTTVNSVKNSQTGTIHAESVFMTASQSAALESTVVNNSGVVEATSLIDLSGAKIQQSGQLLKDANSTSDFKTSVINLTAAESISTNDSSKTAANTLNLKTTKAEAGIGGVFGVNDGTDTTPVSFDADLVNAQTNKGNIYLKDTSGGVKLGTIDTGANLPDPNANFKTSVIANAVGGAIEASNNATDVRRAFSFNLTAGSNSLTEEGNIGLSSNPLRLETSVLSAYAKNGGINISNASFSSPTTPLALILGNIKTEQTVNNILVQAIDDGNGNIRFSDGSAGTKDISIATTGTLAVTDSINATRDLTLLAGGGIQTVGRSINGATIFPTLTAVKFSATAVGDIGLMSQALQTNAETVNVTTTDGGVFLSEQNGLKRADIVATKDIGLSAESGDLVLGKLETQNQKTVNSVTSSTNINVTSKKGSILAAINNSPLVNLQAGELTLSAAGSIGTNNKNLKTSVERIDLTNTSTNSATGSHIDNALALKSLKANVRGTNATFKFINNGQLTFDAVTGKLNLVGGLSESLNFTNDSSIAATQNILLDGLSLGTDQTLTLSATGYVNQTGTNPAIAKEINITAGTGIGVDQPLQTKTSKSTLKTTKGNIQISNDSSDLQVNAKALGNNAQISVEQSGNLLVNAAQGSGKVILHANNGTLNDSANAIIQGNALDAKGISIGSEENAFDTKIQGDNVQLNATSGSINYSNTGNITGTGLNATAAGDMNISNTGNVAFGTLSSTGKMVISLSGEGTDANGDIVNFVVNSAEGLRYAAKSMGTESNKLELKVQKLLIDTNSGGIYAVNSNGTGFSLVRAVASGSGSNINIETDKDLNLGVVESRGNSVSLKSGGKIEDARTPGETSPNVKAKSLELNAASGIGTQGDLALDVSYVAAAGGTGSVKASNASAIALDESTLSNKSVSISASDIIILDNGGRVINLQNGGTLSLNATGGNIVFLNQNDTLSLGGGGNITFVANYVSSDKGYNGAIVAGNLTTNNGGNIKLEAASNITIGMLDAGTQGNVTVISHNGIIVDGNGIAQNIRGNVVSLSAKTPDQNTALINRETAISELAAKEALVSSLTTLKKNNEQSLNSDKRAEQLAQTILKLAEAVQQSTQNDYDTQSAEADAIRTIYDNLMTAYNVAKIVADAVGLPAAIAQAIPFTGDGGSEATAKALEIAAAIAELAADEFDKRYLGPKEADVEELRNQLAEYNANVQSAQSDLSLAQIYRESSEANLAITTDDLTKSTHARDASLQIRRQAITAYELNKDIDSSTTKPLGITANRLDINDGGTVNTSVYLDSTGNIGLGNIKLKAGEDLIVKTEGDVAQVGRVEVSSDISNPSNINRGLISIETKGALEGSPVNTTGIFVADDLSIKAQNGVGLNSVINTEVQNLSVDGGKGVNIYNSSDNSLNITTIGTIVGVSGEGDINLKTEGDLVLKQLIKDTNLSSANTIQLTSAKGSIVDDNLSSLNVQSSQLIANAHNAINVDTQVDGLIAKTDATGQGDIKVRELDDLNIHDVNAGNGNIDILGSNLVVEKIKADGALNDNETGNIFLKARNDSYVRDDGNDLTFIEGKKLTIQAGADVGGDPNQSTSNRPLDTKVDTLDITAQGVVNVTDTDDLNVEKIQTTADVTLQSLTGDLNIGRIVTKTDASQPTTVTLFAKQGAIRNNLTLLQPLNLSLNNINTPYVAPIQSNIVANNLALKAESGVGTRDNNLHVEVDQLEAETQTGGIYLTDHTGDLQIDNVTPGLGLDDLNGLRVSDSGNIEITVANGSLQQVNQVSTFNGNVRFLAQNNVNIGQELKTSAGSIDVQAVTGSITTESDAPISAVGNTEVRGDITLTAATGIEQNAAVSSTGQGEITYSTTAGDLVQNANTTTEVGNIGYTATAGNIRMTETQKTSTGQGDILYTAGQDIESQIVQTSKGNVNFTAENSINAGNAIGTNLGQVQLTARTGSITTESDAPISAVGNTEVRGDITLTAATGIEQNAAVSSTGQGEITYSTTAGDLVQNANTTTEAGNISYTAKAGGITMAANTSTSVAKAGDIKYQANQDIIINELSTLNNHQASLNSENGSITVQTSAAPVQTNVSTGDLILSAKNNIGSLISPLKTKINRLFAKTTSTNPADLSNIYIDEQDGLELAQINTQRGHFNLNSGGNVSARDLNLQGDLTVNTNGQFTTTVPSTVTEAAGLIKADHLIVSADQLVALKTQVNDANIGLKNAGNITLNEQDGINLTRLVTSNGNINIKAQDVITVDQISAAGALAGQVQLNSEKADIQRSGSSQADHNIVAKYLTLNAATGIGSSNQAISTQINDLAASSSSKGIYLNQHGNLTLKDVITPAEIKLNITNGGLVGANAALLKANQATVNAQGSISNLNTLVDRLNVATTQGDIIVREVDGLSRVDAKTLKGNIQLSSDAGDIGLGVIQAADTSNTTTATHLGQVNVKATQGAIRDAYSDDNLPVINIIGQSLTATANTGIGLASNNIEIDVNNLTAQTQTGGIYFNKLNSSDLNLISAAGQPALSAQTGDISVRTAGRLNIQNAIEHVNNGNINVSAQGDINQNANITTHAQGNINVQSDANINMLTNADHTDGVRATTGSGTINYSAGNNLGLSYLQATEFGGSVKVSAQKIEDKIANATNLEGSFIDIKSPALDRNLTEQLIAEKLLESVLIRLNYQVIGGSLSNSRKFMSDLFMQQQYSSIFNPPNVDVDLNDLVKLVNTDLIK